MEPSASVVLNTHAQRDAFDSKPAACKVRTAYARPCALASRSCILSSVSRSICVKSTCMSSILRWYASTCQAMK